MKGQRPQERWTGMYTGNQRRHPLPSHIFRLWSALLVTGVLAVGQGHQESILYMGAEPVTQMLGRQHSDPILQWMSHLNFPPKLCSYSTFKLQPAEMGGMHQWTYMATKKDTCTCSLVWAMDIQRKGYNYILTYNSTWIYHTILELLSRSGFEESISVVFPPIKGWQK